MILTEWLLDVSSTTEKVSLHVATAVELEGRLEVDLGGNVVLGLSLLEVLLGSVEAGNVGLVVLVMVESHDLLRDRGLERLYVQASRSVK